MSYKGGMESKPFGKRQSAQAEAAPMEETHMSPEHHVKLLQGMRDTILNGLLDDWERIRAFQESGRGAGIDDSKRLDELFTLINDRLASLDKRGVAREHLP